MKKKIVIISVLLIAITGILGGMFFNKTKYILNLPKEAEKYSSITLNYHNDIRTIEKSENIEKLINKLVAVERITRKESTQDIPLDMEDFLKIDIKLNEDKSSTIYIYKKAEEYYIEQPYNGVYKITQEEYNDINKFYQDLKIELDMIEKSSIERSIKYIIPVDQIGKSFNVDELTNEELLRYGYFLLGPKKNYGFEHRISLEDLNKYYIKAYFWNKEAVADDIYCSCGEKIAYYNETTKEYTWDDQEFHYLDHSSKTFNEVKEFYKIEDTYIAKVYKIFPDLLMNSSTTQFNFYATYNDAVNQENVLFTVTNEDDFTEAVGNLDDSKKVLYTLKFKKESSSLKLVSYEINN